MSTEQDLVYGQGIMYYLAKTRDDRERLCIIGSTAHPNNELSYVDVEEILSTFKDDCNKYDALSRLTIYVQNKINLVKICESFTYDRYCKLSLEYLSGYIRGIFSWI